MTQQQYNIDVQLDTSPNKARVTNGTITPRNWLEQWPIARRSLISDLFHYAVRDGATTPALIINAVQGSIERRLQYVPPPPTVTDETLHAVWQALQAAPQGAYAYAESVLAWKS